MGDGQSKKSPKGNNPEGIKFPLREKGDVAKFFRYLFVYPILAVLIVNSISGYLLFQDIYWEHFLWVNLAHAAFLGIFLALLWVPSWLTFKDWSDRAENRIIYIRNALLILSIILLFPHRLVQHFLSAMEPRRDLWIPYVIIISLLTVVYFELTRRKLHLTAFRDIRAAATTQERRHSERWLWFESMSFFLVLLGIIVIELWFIASMGNNRFIFQPAEIFIPGGIPGPPLHREMTMLAWFCCSAFSALLFFLTACLGNRLMGGILIPVTFHERDFRGIIQKSYRYLRHFALAMLIKYPFLLVGGVLITIMFLIIPLILISAGRFELLKNLAQADQVILAAVVFIAWFSPLTIGAVHPDETFGEYFNQRLANLLMVIQSHLVLIGFGSLGKRVLDREVRLMLKRGKGDHFMEVVTPDIRLEYLCNHAVVIERSPKDVIFSGDNSLLGRYGVVSSAHEPYKTKDPNGNIVYNEKRALVPVVIGEAKEPFIGSRVNLERARLIISTVPDEESVQAIFDRANKAHVSSIICVSRSDQISYLTYRARHRRIVLVYPKHNQGTTLGHRLWAAMLKVRSTFAMKKNQWPKVLIVGNNKANQFMLETLWLYLPGSPNQITKLLKENFAFIVTAPESSIGYPILKDKGKTDPFDLSWPALFVTGSRFPYESMGPLNLQDFLQATRVVNEADQNAIQACILEFKPEIVVLNQDSVEKTPLLLARCVRALERIKSFKKNKFRLPLILLTAVQGDERERQILGDASRYYDALCKLHKEPMGMDASYPSHARYAYYAREIIGESISDGLADAEEVIAGARRSFSIPFGKAPKGNVPEEEKQFIEISSCLPNRPGALANFLARLAGIEFIPSKRETIEALWKKGRPEGEKMPPHMPSFQYLRNIILDPDGKGYALTGYASLVPLREDSPIFESPSPESSSVVRVFANDGRNYLEKEVDPDELYDQKDSANLAKILQNIEEPKPPGVPNVIDRLTRRPESRANTVGEFREVLLNPQDKGKFACPGMSLCRVAAFQDYVTGGNYRRLGRQAELDKELSGETLRNSRNYYCCTGMKSTTEEEKPGADSPYARVFCCSYGTNDPSLIAMVLNTLILRPQMYRAAEEGDKENDWIINIDYFKDVACQNSYFALNRVFGYFQKKSKSKKSNPPPLPLHLIRILPIGGPESAKLWFTYTRALYYFLSPDPENPAYKFYWLDGNHNRHEEGPGEPAFDSEDRKTFPIVLVIKKISMESVDLTPKKCKICGLEDRVYDCSKLRVWI